MIEVTNVSRPEFEAAVRGMRNSWDSHDKSDSEVIWTKKYELSEKHDFMERDFVVGENDLKLMKKLVRAGSDHAKFMRQITLSFDLNAPLYFWKQFDTYKVGTTANSESTMHQIQAKPFSFDMFSFGIKEKNNSFEVESEELNEVWVAVSGYENEYKLSNTGKLKSIARDVVAANGKVRTFKGIELKPNINSSGYKKFVLHKEGTKKNVYLHRLLAEHFIKNEFDWKTEVNHKDGNKLNNNISNLEWVSKSENALHAFELGLSKVSGYNKKKVRESIGRFTEEQVNEIRKKRKNGRTTTELAKEYKCYTSTICNIVNNKSYKDIEFDDSDMIKMQLDYLELLRIKFIETKDKNVWDLLIALLPSGFNQKRTVTLNYAVLSSIYHSRKSHKLKEWHEFCDWIETLPYSELITGKVVNE